VRAGRVVRTLTGGRRTLLGMDATTVVVGQEQLEPGDVVVLYTDGITDARDADGRPFGLAGLTDLLLREYAATSPLPEIVRRVGKAVLARQGGAVRDDATLLLAQWTPDGAPLLDPEVR
jgi:serine phosphatase RsbU (regulator of sigma subunit)